MKKNETRIIIRFILFLIFIYYIFYLLKTLIFARLFAKDFVEGISLVPFSHKAWHISSYGNDFLYSGFFKNLIFNIGIFIPAGFLLPFLFKFAKKLLNILGIVIIFSLAIEMLQYITKTGVTAVDDIIFAILGTIVGYLIFIFFKEAYRSL